MPHPPSFIPLEAILPLKELVGLDEGLLIVLGTSADTLRGLCRTFSDTPSMTPGECDELLSGALVVFQNLYTQIAANCTTPSGDPISPSIIKARILSVCVEHLASPPRDGRIINMEAPPHDS